MSVDPTPAGSRLNRAKITIKYVSPYAELMPIVWLADHTVVFTHIPKAAGTTLYSILEDIAADHGLKCLRVTGTLYGQFLGPGKPDTLADLRGLSNEALSAAQFLTGHLPFGVPERFDQVLKALIGLYGWPDLAYTDIQVTRARIGGELEIKVAEAARRIDALDAELYAWAASREVPWTDGLFAGAARGTAKQDQVLLTTSILYYYRQELSPRPSFQSICDHAMANGDAVEFV